MDVAGQVMVADQAIIDDVDIDFGTAEIEVELTNTGVFVEASGDARLRPREDRTDFRVEIEDLPLGTYQLHVGGIKRGDIAVTLIDGEHEGEIEFDTDPDDPGEVLLDFDPRGQLIEVSQGGTVDLSRTFPN